MQVGYKIAVNTLTLPAPTEIAFENDYAGKLSQVTWKIGEEFLHGGPDDVIKHTIQTPGRWTIESQAYDENGLWVGLSQVTINVTDPNDSTKTFE